MLFVCVVQWLFNKIRVKTTAKNRLCDKNSRAHGEDTRQMNNNMNETKTKHNRKKNWSENKTVEFMSWHILHILVY